MIFCFRFLDTASTADLCKAVIILRNFSFLITENMFSGPIVIYKQAPLLTDLCRTLTADVLKLCQIMTTF